MRSTQPELRGATSCVEFAKRLLLSADVSGCLLSGFLLATLLTCAAAQAATPSEVWVDATYNSGSAGGHTWQYDAFNKIQDGVNAVASSGTVNVADGLYKESNITLTKGLTIIGQSRAGVKIAPAAADSNDADNWSGTPQQGFIVQSSDVRIEYLTIDGQANTSLTGNNFRVGIATDDRLSASYDNLIIDNITVTNYYFSGISVGNTGSGLSITGSGVSNAGYGSWPSYGIYTIADGTISGNTLVNAGYRSIGAEDASVTVASNDVTMTDIDPTQGSDGIYVSPFYNPTATVTVRANTIHANNVSLGAIGLNLVGLTDNTVIGGTTPADGNTIYLDTSDAADIGIVDWWNVGQPLIQNNIVHAAGYDAGMWLFHNETPATGPLIRGNTISSTASTIASYGDGTGIFMTDDGATYFGDEDGAGYATIQGNTISNFQIGIALYRNGTAPAGGRDLVATIGGNHISGNTTGVCFIGGGTGTVGGALPADGNNFVGPADNVIDLLLDSLAGTVTIAGNNHFAGDTYFINNQSSQPFNLVGNGTTFDLADNFRIEDRIYHRVDNPSKGLITWVGSNVYVTSPQIANPDTTTSDSSIQMGINAVPAGQTGWTVNVENGLYKESNITMTQGLAIVGQSRAGVKIAPAAADSNDADNWSGTPQQGFIVQSSDVRIEYLTIDGQANTSLTGNNFRVGILTDDRLSASYDNLIIDNIAVTNYYLSGISVGNTGSGLSITGSGVSNAGYGSWPSYGIYTIADGTISGNTLVNAGYRSIGAEDASVTVSGNTVTINDNDPDFGSDGIYVSAYYNPGADLTVRANTVTAEGVNVTGGVIGLNLVGGGDNTVIGGLNASDGNEIYINDNDTADVGIVDWWNVGQPLIQNNTISASGDDAGIWLFHNETAETGPIISDNTISTTGSSVTYDGDGTGIFMTDDGSIFGDEDGASYATIRGNTISNFVNGIELYPSVGPGVVATFDAADAIAGVTTYINNGNLALGAGDTLALTINGATEGSNYAQLEVNGAVSLGGATLSLSSAATFLAGDSLRLIRNTGGAAVSGTFAGLLDGATVTLNGHSFNIIYDGGAGHDVVLLPAATTLVVADFISPTAVGIAGNFTVTAMYDSNTPAPGYRGTVRFTSDGTLAVLPAGDYTFLTSDAGTHTFSATFGTAGTWYITATDTSTGTITGTQPDILVYPAAQITKRETQDTDGNGRIDAIRIETNTPLDDNFDGLVITVVDTQAGYTYTVQNYYTGSTNNDNEFFVRLYEGPVPDTGATPDVQVLVGGSLGLVVDAAGVAATDKAAPVLMTALWVEGSAGGVEPGDAIQLTFSEPVTSNHALITDFGLPVQNDKFGDDSTVSTGQNNNDPKVLTITLQGDSYLTPGGVYSKDVLTAGSPTGIYVENGSRIVDAAVNTALNQGIETAVDLEPGTEKISICWADLTIAPRNWNIGDSTFGFTYQASHYYGFVGLNGLLARNNGNVREKFTINCSTSSPAAWTVATDAGQDQFELKAAAVKIGPPYPLDLATGPKDIATGLYSGHNQEFDLQFRLPTSLTAGLNEGQTISATITATKD